MSYALHKMYALNLDDILKQVNKHVGLDTGS